jgi:MerR family redox-sensitive transcriptional activator SoxR
MKQVEALSVGVLAKRAGVAVSTLHFYEEKGLIHSSRTAGNQRRYKKETLRRVAVIKTAQKLGISLNDIERAFASLPDERTPTQKDWERLSKVWQNDLDERIEILGRLRQRLSGCIGCGCLSMKSCPLYNDDDHLVSRGSGAVLLDNDE